MKCHDFLGNLRTGGIWQRLAARLHATRCGRCAAAERHMAELERELARTEPLSADQRRLWAQAARLEAERPARATPQLAVFAAVAAILLVAVTATLLYFGKAPPREPGNSLPGVEIAQEDTSLEEESLRQVAHIQRDLRALLADLDQLSSMAALLDERKQLDELLQQVEEL